MPDIFDRLAASPAPAGGRDIFDRVGDDNAARAYRLLNEPDPELLDLAHRMGAQLAALKGRAPAPRQDPAYTPDLPMQFIGPEPAGAMTPQQAAQAAQDRGRPGERHWKALLHGVQGSATVLPARRKLPDALEPGQVPDLTTGERLAMQAGTLAGDFPLMVFGALLGVGSTIETGPGAVAGAAYGAWTLPAGVRKVYMDRIGRGEVKSFGEFAFRLASAVDHANRAGFVGLATAGVGQAARAAGPLVSLPAEVATMTAAGAAFEGRVPDAQEFADAALLVGGLHAATATARGVGRVRASFDLAGRLRDIYARTGKRPAEVALEARDDPGIREHLLSEGEGLPPGYEKMAQGQDAPSPYFKPTEGSVRVPLDALVAREAPSAERLAHAHELMDAAKAGTGEAREPLQVRDVGGGRYQVVEGNTSLHALRERGETHAVAQVVGPGERGHAGVQTLDQAYEQAAAALPAFVATVRDIAAKNGAAVSFRDGPKGRERAEAKAKDKGPGMVRDLVCGTVIARDQAGIRSILDDVGRSFEIVRVKDKFAQPQADGYRDMLVNVRTPSGHVAEIQISTREMAEAKSLLGHKLYRVVKELQELPETAELKDMKDKLNGVSRQYYDAVAGGKSAIASAREIGIPLVSILARFSANLMGIRSISSAVESLRTTLNTLPDSSSAQGVSSQSKKVSSMSEPPAPGPEPGGNANITPPGGGGKAPAPDARAPLAALSDAADRAGEGMDNTARTGIESAHEVQERGRAAGGPGPAAQDGLERPPGGGRPVPGVRAGDAGAGGEAGGQPGGAARGRAVAVIHSEGDVPAHYEVREAADLIPSHDPRQGFARRPDYPEGVQERPYHSDQGEQLKVKRNANELRPELLLTDNPDATNGPPVVDPSGVVLGGNSRAMSVQLAYEQGGERAEAYRQALADKAAAFGLDPAALGGFQQPVLVRVLDAPADGPGMARQVRLYNQPLTQGLDARAEGVSRGRLVSEATFGHLAGALEDFPTLREYLGSTRSRELIRRLVDDGVIEERQLSRLTNKESGLLAEDGKRLVEQVLLGRVIPDFDLLDAAPPALLQKIGRALPDMAKVQARGEGWDITPALRDGLSLIVTADRRGQDLHRFLASPSLDPSLDHPAKFDRTAVRLALALAEMKPTEFSAAWKEFARQAGSTSRGQSILPGVRTATPEEAIKTFETKKGKSGGKPGGEGGEHPFFNTGRAATDVPFPDKPAMPAGEVRAEDATRISDVVRLLEDKLGAPIRTGKIAGAGPLRQALGIYKVKPEVIRTRLANNVAVVAHEVGHHLQKTVLGGIEEGPLEPWRAELAAMATPDRLGRKNSLTEGFAEFIAKYVANPEQARQMAPRFLEHFEAEMDKKAPQIKAVLLDAREMVRRWSEQPAVMEVLSHIDKGGSRSGLAWKLLFDKETWHTLYTGLVDDLHQFSRIVREMAEGKDLPTSQDPEVLARLFRGWWGKGAHFLEHGAMDYRTLETTGPSLKAILNRVGNWDELRAYLVALRALELETRGIESGVRAEAAKATVAELAPRYKDAARALYEYQDQVLRYLVDSGTLSEKNMLAMREANKYYVPFFRVMDSEKGPGGVGGKALASRNPVKRIKGSGRDIVDPLESILKNTYLLVNLAERNRVGLALVDLAARAEGMGRYVERIPTPLAATKVHGEEVLRAVAKQDPEVAALLKEMFGQEDFDTTIFRPGQWIDRQSEIAVFRRGKRELYQVHPDIAAAVNGLGAESIPAWVRLLAFPTRTLRAGATLTPDFIMRNSVRDPLTAAVFSKWGFTPGVDSVRGLFHLLRKDDLYQEWLKSGAGHSMWVSLDRQYLQEGLADLRQSGVLDRVRNVARHPVEILRVLSEAAEAATRLGEFARARAKQEGKGGADAIMQAGADAREVTLDFARIGSAMRGPNALIAFTNARIQGLDKLAREFRDRPLAASAKAAAWITLPSVLLALANYQFASEEDVKRVLDKKARGEELDPLEQDIFMRESVKSLPRWQRDLFWIVPAGGVLWRIPKPFELGVIFGSIPERVTEWILDRSRGDLASRPFAELGTSIWEGVKPAVLPTAATPLLENWGNRSFLTGNRIVPADREGMLPEYQYTPNTTELMKSMAQVLGRLPYGRVSGLASPAMTENLVRGWTGGLGLYLLQAADFGLRHAGIVPNPVKPAATLADLPVVRAFVARHPSANTQPVRDFYEHWDQAQQVANTIAGMKREMNFEVMQTLVGQGDFGALKGIHDAMGNLNAFIRMVAANPELTPDKKREFMDTAYLQLHTLAKSGNEIWARVQESRGEAQGTGEQAAR